MNKETVYDVDYFIKKFEAIPEDKWQEGGWGEYDKHCAGGHCGIKTGMLTRAQYPPEFLALEELLRALTIVRVHSCGGYSDYITIVINDGMAMAYLQANPKQRILAALYDVKKLQEPLYKDATAEILEKFTSPIEREDKVREKVKI